MTHDERAPHKAVLALVTLTVIIAVTENAPIGCPMPPPPPPVKQEDGTYLRSRPILAVPAVVCWSTSEWREEWTDYPERGGQFIRRVPSSENDGKR